MGLEYWMVDIASKEWMDLDFGSCFCFSSFLSSVEDFWWWWWFCEREEIWSCLLVKIMWDFSLGDSFEYIVEEEELFVSFQYENKRGGGWDGNWYGLDLVEWIPSNSGLVGNVAL